MVTRILCAPIGSLLCAWRGGDKQWAERGGTKHEVSYQPSVRVSRLTESQQHLPQVNAEHELHKFVQDVTDQETRVLVRVVIYLENLPIRVDHARARVGAEAEGGVATLTQVLEPVARPEELGRQTRGW